MGWLLEFLVVCFLFCEGGNCLNMVEIINKDENKRMELRKNGVLGKLRVVFLEVK